MGEVKTFPVRGKRWRRTKDENSEVVEELLGIANRLEAVAVKTPYPKWLTALASEVRNASKACDGE